MRLIHFKCIIFVAKFMLKFLFFPLLVLYYKKQQQQQTCSPLPTLSYLSFGLHAPMPSFIYAAEIYEPTSI